jgi:hypothetical protein
MPLGVAFSHEDHGHEIAGGLAGGDEPLGLGPLDVVFVPRHEEISLPGDLDPAQEHVAAGVVDFHGDAMPGAEGFRQLGDGRADPGAAVEEQAVRRRCPGTTDKARGNDE